jgi:ketosteroid isomerase-like protein
MNEQSNVAVLRRAYEAFARADFAALNECFHEESVWHVPGNSLVSGAHKGRDAVFAFFGRLMELSGGTFKAEGRDIGASDTRAYSLEHLTAARAGKTLDVELVLVVRVEGGRIVEGRDFFSDQAAWDDFWA